MVFLGLERPVEYGRQQIFDPTTAQMVLQAQDQYANALYRDYVRGLEDMKEFNKEYGNFVTPILADQEWYNKNVIDKVRGTIQRMYEAGIDPTRSVQGRAAISQLINSIDVGSVNKLRSSAANAEEFLKARKQLEAQGLYNPLLAKYDGPDINTYSTLDRLDENGNVVSGSGVWDKMSPTRITDMATFGNPYFEGMKPNIHKVSKNGVEYSIESITAEDLNRIANDHFNELVSTPQGQLMYKYYRDLAGGDSNPNADIEARRNFNAAVASGQSRRIYQSDNYDDQWVKREQLKQGWTRIRQENEKLDIERAKAGIGPDGQTTGRESWTKRQRDNIKEGMNVYANAVNQAKLGVTFAGAKKQLISEGVKNPSTKQVNERISKNKQAYFQLINQMTNSKGLTGENLSYLNAYYNAYQTNITGEDAKTALALAADLADPEAINDIQSGHKRLPIMFEPDGNLNLTRQREAAYAGVSLTKGSITNQLYKYLSDHGIEGFIPNRDVTVNRMPYGDYGVWDINFTGRFRKQDLAKFKGAGSDEFYNAIANAGGRYVTNGGKVIEAEEGDDKGKIKWADIEYVDLPVSRTIDERKHTSWQIDDYHRRRVYGQKKAAEAASTSND